MLAGGVRRAAAAQHAIAAEPPHRRMMGWREGLRPGSLLRESKRRSALVCDVS